MKLRSNLMLLGIILAGIALRSVAIEDRPIWFDEAFSWRITRYPLAEMIERIRQDVHPPLYYLVLKGWTAIWGSSVSAMRLLSVIWGGLSVLGTYLFISEAFSWRSHARLFEDSPGSGARRAADADAGLTNTSHAERAKAEGPGLPLLAAALVATSIFQIRYAWEIRMYAQGAALAAFSNWAFFRAMRSSSTGDWTAWSLISTAFAYTHYYAFFSLAAQGLFLAGSLTIRALSRRIARNRERESPTPFGAPALRELADCASHSLGTSAGTFVRACLAGGLLLLLYAPWLSSFLAQQAQVQESFWAWPVDRWTVPATLYQMLIGGPATDTFDRGIEHPAMAIGAALTFAGLLFLLIRGSSGERFIVLASVVPLLLAAAFSFATGRSIYTNRYFTFAQLGLLAALAALVWRIPAGTARGACALLVVVGNLALDVRFVAQLNVPTRSGARGAARLLLEHAAIQDPVVVGNSRVFLPLDYYCRGHLRTRLLSVPHRIEHFGGRQVLDEGDRIELSDVWAARARDVWIVDTTGFGGGDVPVPVAWRPAEIWVFPELFWWQGEIILKHYRTSGERSFEVPGDFEKLLPVPSLPFPG